MKVQANIWVENIESFDLLKIDKYRDTFENFKKSGHISDKTNFEDYKWIVKIRGEEAFLIFFNDIELQSISNNLGLNREFINNSIKTFMLNYVEISSITQIRFIMRAAKLIYTQKHEEFANLTNKTIVVLEKFDTFIGNIQADYVEKLSESVVDISYKTKMLTSFLSIFRFNEIIDSFYKNNIDNSSTLLLKYYPIIVWWKLTSVIPLRPSELVNMDRNCIEAKNGEYYITVKRSLGKRNSYKFNNTSIESGCYEEDKLNIDEEMYLFLQKYIKTVEKYDGNYIFSKKLYRECALNYNEPFLNVDKFTVLNLSTLLNMFYSKIVQNIYVICDRKGKKFESINENEIEKITLYDARHIAIINAIFLGYDIQTVQRIARHAKVNTTYGYFQHQHEYATSFAIALSKKLIQKDAIKKIPSIRKTNNGNRLKLLSGSVFGKDNKSNNRKDFKSVGGYCEYDTDKDISYCLKFLPSHDLCPHFILYDDNIQIERAKLKLENSIKVLFKEKK